MLPAERNLYTDSLLLAGVLQCHDDARVRGYACRRLLPVFSDPKFLKDDSHRTELGESILEKVQADKGRKKEPICAL
jgi:hypothetical protein